MTRRRWWLVGGGLAVLLVVFWTIGTVVGPSPKRTAGPVSRSPVPARSVVSVAARPSLSPSVGSAPAPAPSPSLVAVRSSSLAPAPAGPRPGLVHPDQAAQDRYLAAVQAVDAGLVADRDRAVRVGRNACLDLAESRDLAVRNTMARVSVAADVAGRLVDAARTHFCPG